MRPEKAKGTVVEVRSGNGRVGGTVAQVKPERIGSTVTYNAWEGMWHCCTGEIWEA